MGAVKRGWRRGARAPRSFDAVGVFDEAQFDERVHLEVRRAERYFVFLSLLVVRVDCLEWHRGRWTLRKKDDFQVDVGEVLKRNTRDIDAVFAFADGTFGVLLPETNDEGAYEAAHRLRRLVESSRIPRLSPIAKLRMSFGIGAFPSDARNKHQLIAKARKSLREAIRFNRRRLPVRPGGHA